MEYTFDNLIRRDEDGYVSSIENGDQLVVQIETLMRDGLDSRMSNRFSEFSAHQITHKNSYEDKTIEPVNKVVAGHLNGLAKFFRGLLQQIKEYEVSNTSLLEMVNKDNSNDDQSHGDHDLSKNIDGLKEKSKIKYGQLLLLMKKQKSDLIDRINQFKNRAYELEKMIQEKESQLDEKNQTIAHLEQKLFNMKSVMVDEFKAYEKKVLEMVRRFEAQKKIKMKQMKKENDELKTKLDSKRHHISYLQKECNNNKSTIQKLLTEKHTLTKQNESMKETTMETDKIKEMEHKIEELLEEKNKLQKRNSFQNKSIKELLNRIKDLQTQIKKIEIRPLDSLLNYESNAVTEKSVDSITDRLKKEFKIGVENDKDNIKTNRSWKNTVDCHFNPSDTKNERKPGNNLNCK